MFRIKCEEGVVAYINENAIRMLVFDGHESQVTILAATSRAVAVRTRAGGWSRRPSDV